MKELEKIIKTTPLGLRPMLKLYSTFKGGYLCCECKGFVRPIPWKDWGLSHYSFNKYGIGLSYECDNMAKTLLHEALHIKYENASEVEIELNTNKYWQDLPLRKVCQQRIVTKLGELNV